jgi:hypothetical protein
MSLCRSDFPVVGGQGKTLFVVRLNNREQLFEGYCMAVLFKKMNQCLDVGPACLVKRQIDKVGLVFVWFLYAFIISEIFCYSQSGLLPGNDGIYFVFHKYAGRQFITSPHFLSARVT